ncbi:nuclease-related domain-containing protein [Aquipuribacter nitratireducens]|uniref:Nuclease-related domain-containing protein n=1 Tax=Aquipuribacter nitratireducens TaxID=650104 RepID=A0ABW0GIY1_9MICO
MNAGAGAQEQARRHEERVAALTAQRAAIDARIEAASRQQQAWQAGADGEQRVGALLDALGPGWQVLHDVHWPGRQKANLDHVVVGPTGVWVVDTKNWSGAVSLRDGVLRCGGYRKGREADAVMDAAAALAATLPPHQRGAVRGLLCLAGSGADLDVAAVGGGTLVVGAASLVELVTSGPPVLGPQQLDEVADTLVATTAVPPRRTGKARTAGTRRVQSGLRSALLQLLKVAVVLLGMWALVEFMPYWAPLLQDLIATTVTGPALERIQDAATVAPAPAG